MPTRPPIRSTARYNYRSLDDHGSSYHERPHGGEEMRRDHSRVASQNRDYHSRCEDRYDDDCYDLGRFHRGRARRREEGRRDDSRFTDRDRYYYSPREDRYDDVYYDLVRSHRGRARRREEGRRDDSRFTSRDRYYSSPREARYDSVDPFECDRRGWRCSTVPRYVPADREEGSCRCSWCMDYVSPPYGADRDNSVFDEERDRDFHGRNRHIVPARDTRVDDFGRESFYDTDHRLRRSHSRRGVRGSHDLGPDYHLDGYESRVRCSLEPHPRDHDYDYDTYTRPRGHRCGVGIEREQAWWLEPNQVVLHRCRARTAGRYRTPYDFEDRFEDDHMEHSFLDTDHTHRPRATRPRPHLSSHSIHEDLFQNDFTGRPRAPNAAETRHGRPVSRTRGRYDTSEHDTEDQEREHSLTRFERYTGYDRGLEDGERRLRQSNSLTPRPTRPHTAAHHSNTRRQEFTRMGRPDPFNPHQAGRPHSPNHEAKVLLQSLLETPRPSVPVKAQPTSDTVRPPPAANPTTHATPRPRPRSPSPERRSFRSGYAKWRASRQHSPPRSDTTSPGPVTAQPTNNTARPPPPTAKPTVEATPRHAQTQTSQAPEGRIGPNGAGKVTTDARHAQTQTSQAPDGQTAKNDTGKATTDTCQQAHAFTNEAPKGHTPSNDILETTSWGLARMTRGNLEIYGLTGELGRSTIPLTAPMAGGTRWIRSVRLLLVGRARARLLLLVRNRRAKMSLVKNGWRVRTLKGRGRVWSILPIECVRGRRIERASESMTRGGVPRGKVGEWFTFFMLCRVFFLSFFPLHMLDEGAKLSILYLSTHAAAMKISTQPLTQNHLLANGNCIVGFMDRWRLIWRWRVEMGVIVTTSIPSHDQTEVTHTPPIPSSHPPPPPSIQPPCYVAANEAINIDARLPRE